MIYYRGVQYQYAVSCRQIRSTVRCALGLELEYPTYTDTGRCQKRRREQKSKFAKLSTN